MTDMDCGIDDRRRLIFGNGDWNGIDYLDVADDQRSLCVHFFNGVPQGITAGAIRITGGRRITGIRVTGIAVDPSHDEELDDCLRIELDRPGDFSTYTLCVADVPGIDPRFRCLDFSFKAGCASDLDCGTVPPCPVAPREEPAIDYLAKDYASFRQLLYDRMALLVPDWRERHVPDLGVTLVELLAYAGDMLSYYQDAVATEAYLGTARQRISVRRHLRLIDYAMHEGCNARAAVTISTDADFDLAGGSYFFVAGVETVGSGRSGLAPEAELETVEEDSYLVFEPVAPSGGVTIRAAHGSIGLYAWGDKECCLPEGATAATLVDHVVPSPAEDPEVPGDDGEPDGGPDPSGGPSQPIVLRAAPAAAGPAGGRRLRLTVGDLLIFEEVLGALTGVPGDADPAHRHLVRLTRVEPGYDALLGVALLHVEWAVEDALPFALCLSARRPAPDCEIVTGISVARGNVVLVDHGRSREQPLDPFGSIEVALECACEGSVVETRRLAADTARTLDHAPLTFAEPVPANVTGIAFAARDPRLALPQVDLTDGVLRWTAKPDLIGSRADDRVFVAEIDDMGTAHLRFGDGVHGRVPEAGSGLTARYRTGCGAIGNVGREAIGLLVLREGSSIDGASIVVRNPLSASGGTDPEPMAEARLFAPGLIKAVRERAIIAEDYAELALRDARLQGAAAALVWTGSWWEARVAVDPSGSENCPPALRTEVGAALGRYRRIGHDLAVDAARIVPLHLKLKVCVAPHYSRSQVKGALLDIFTSRRRADGKPGFFHPDNWRFGEDVAVSRIVASAMAVDGVETVAVVTLARLGFPSDIGVIEHGLLTLAAGEIARLDGDPNFPEQGRLEIEMGGGR